jgi:ferrous iron transport protein B
VSLAAEPKTITVALLGNPNTGKSTLFTALCGVRQRTGNYPGVTVEKKTGRLRHAGRSFEIIDLPGTYSLAPRSPDEMVAVDVLLGRQIGAPRPDVVVCIVDASNLERNLYLVSQILELGLPVVLALNMVDAAKAKGVSIDAAALQKRLKLPVVPLQAHKRIGIEQLRETIDRAAESGSAPVPESPLPEAFQREVDVLQQRDPQLPRYLAERLILDTSGYLAGAGLPGVTPELIAELSHVRIRLAKAKCSVPGIEALSRYQWIARVLDGVVARKSVPVSLADRVDRVLTHRVWGSLSFVAVMVAMFASVFWLAQWPMAGIEAATGFLGELVQGSMPDGPLRSLLVDGVIAGVGGVVVFLPQILILFLFIGALEDCGYMARAAFLMDRLMSRVGLSGKSFIPLLSSFACAIPGIMGTRVIENSRDRLVTILVAPLMSCSARIPVYMLLAGTFVPTFVILQTGWFQGFDILRPLVVASMYFLGIVAAALVALVLKRTILRGPTPPFVLELPMYKIPSVRGVIWRSLDRGWTFVKSAGSLILAISILVWAAAYFPHREEAVRELLDQKPVAEAQVEETAAEYAVYEPMAAEHAALDEKIQQLGASAPADLIAKRDALAQDLEPHLPMAARHEQNAAALADLEHEIQARWLADSYLGRLGQAIEPAVKPLGWDWRIGCAAIASFPAREVVVATLGVIFNLGSDVDEESQSLREALQSATWPDGRPLFNLPVALSLMVFFSLCAQCAATLVTIRRETNSWRWPAFTFVYMTGLAYVAALLTYQVGAWLGGA